MNELHMIDNYYLRVMDKFNFVVIEKIKNKKGEDIEKSVGYFGTVQSAFKSILNITLKSSYEPLTVKNILNAIDVLSKKIDALKCEHILKLCEGHKR